MFLEFEEKNTSKKCIDNFLVENEFSLFRINATEDSTTLCKRVDKKVIQFYFCIEGGAVFCFSNGNYKLELEQNKSFIIYNPETDLPINLRVKRKSKVVAVYLSIKKLHELFIEDYSQITFLKGDNIDKKFYSDRDLSLALSVVVGQILQYKNKSLNNLYFGGKIRELFAIYFGEQENEDERCPFLSNEENVRKVKQAKNIIIENMMSPPCTSELARMVGLSVHKLTTGFKNVYGDTIYSFLQNYKIEYARKILQDSDTKINDVAYTIGYSNPSHFIDAFKKKYGITPKKFKMSLR